MSESPEVDIRALASLSRIALTDDEAVHMEGEVRSILALVQTVQDAPVTLESETAQRSRSVMREDDDAYGPGSYSEALLNAAPMREGDYVEVLQVLSHVKKPKGGSKENAESA